jgi:hypothetical protein
MIIQGYPINGAHGYVVPTAVPAAAVGLDVQVAQLAPPAYALSADFAIAPAATPATPISPFAYAPERAVAGAGGGHVTPEVNRQLRPCAVPPLALPLSAQSGSPADCSAYSRSCSPVDSARGSAGSAASTRPVAVAIAVPLYDRPAERAPHVFGAGECRAADVRDGLGRGAERTLTIVGAAGGGPHGEAAQAGMDWTTPPASPSGSTMPSGSDEEARGETAYV